MNGKVLMRVVGVSTNRLGSGISALILRQAGGQRCLPIVIGNAEAQSIRCCLQRIIPIRPLTHDLMADMLTMLGGTLAEIYIYRLPDGIFAANLMIDRNGKRESIDARSSDAVALALRLDAPIYTSAEVLESAGFDQSDSENSNDMTKAEPEVSSDNKKVDNEQDEELRLKILEMTAASFSEEALQKILNDAVERENYREAGIIKRELDHRNNQKPDAL